MEPEFVLQLLAVQLAELWCDELHIVGDEGERLDLGDGRDGPRGGRQGGARPRVQCPTQQLLAAEVAGSQIAGIEKPGPASVCGVGIEAAT